LDRKNPRVWYWALMDYGTWLKKTEKNPSRRSSSHRTQKPFKNSDRMIRGMILKALSENGPMREEKICSLPGALYGRLFSQMEALAEEGLIREEKGVYFLGD
ncbi:MAG: A/G-specific adenine glycosylase, partial [Spirochaetota bacterium]